MKDWRRILPPDVPRETAHWCRLVRAYWTGPNPDMERLMETLGVIAKTIQKIKRKKVRDEEVMEVLAEEWISIVCYLLDRAAHQSTLVHPPDN